MRALLLVIAAVMLLSSTNAVAQGPSFDCNMATTQVEVIICEDTALSLLDNELSIAYKKLFTTYKDKLKLMSEQNKWINSRNNDCLTSQNVKP
jgi:uncharacterized protein